jgi:hypothetical protein
LSTGTAREISPKQAALAISDDQNAIHSKAGMTFSSSAGGSPERCSFNVSD